MSDSDGDGQSGAAAESSPEPAPTDSGTTSTQQESAAALTGELVPNPQLSQIAECVSDELSGLIAADPDAVRSVGTMRLAASYVNEQRINTAALRRDVVEARERERAATDEASELRTKLAVATNINDTEAGLRKPRAIISVLGVAVAGFGVDQFVGGDTALGAFLVLVGLATAAATYFIAPARGRNQ